MTRGRGDGGTTAGRRAREGGEERLATPYRFAVAPADGAPLALTLLGGIVVLLLLGFAQIAYFERLALENGRPQMRREG